MLRLARLAVMSLAVGQLVGCGGRPGQGPSPSRPVIVTVTNNSPLDADLYAVGSSGRYHLGFVPAAVTATMYVPSYIVAGGGRLRLRVEPVGGSRYWTPPLQVQPGDHVTAQLASAPQFSTFVPGT